MMGQYTSNFYKSEDEDDSELEIIEEDEVQEEEDDEEEEEEDTNKKLKRSKSSTAFTRENFYKTCCGSIIDRRALLFFTQLCISLIGIGFSIYKLSHIPTTAESCTEQNAWFIMLSSTLAVWLPTPKLH
jgi:hypothetical protein